MLSVARPMKNMEIPKETYENCWVFQKMFNYDNELSANLVKSHVSSQQHAVITNVEVYAGSVEICKKYCVQIFVFLSQFSPLRLITGRSKGLFSVPGV